MKNKIRITNRYFQPFQMELEKYVAGIHHLNDGVSEERIKNLEKSLGISFPSRYRDFLKMYNGGELFAVPAGTMLAQIYIPENGPKKTGIRYLDESFKENRRWPDLLDSYLIIADTSYGDLLCLDLSASDGIEANIVSWSHELREVDESWKKLIDWLMSEMMVGNMGTNYDGSEK